MITNQSFEQTLSHSSWPSAPRVGTKNNRLWLKGSAAFAGALAIASIGACAVTGPYNPDHISNDLVAQVADICQTTMGLSPNDLPVYGTPLGGPGPDPDMSHYQVCIASLADSLQNVREARVAQEADQGCHAKGYASGSPELAECVLQRVRAPLVPVPAANSASDSEVALRTAKNEKPPRSFYFASPRETRRREEVACARLGLEPPYGEFEKCVNRLDRSFYALDNPIT